MPILASLRELLVCALILIAAKIGWCTASCPAVHIAMPLVAVDFHCGNTVLWELRTTESVTYRFTPPILPLREREATAGLGDIHLDGPTDEGAGIVQYVVGGRLQSNPGLALKVVVRFAQNSPMVRFRYALEAEDPNGRDTFGTGALDYFDVTIPGLKGARQVQLSQFEGLTHSYNLEEDDFTLAQLESRKDLMGPILALAGEKQSLVLAYEHGSTVPQAFLQYSAIQDGIRLRAEKGNVYPGEIIDAQHPWESIWFDAGSIAGPLDGLAPVFRSFVLRGMTNKTETRRPYIFYNTWNYQERQKWSAHRDYLESINLQRALKEIDVAHQIGIDVYVLDTGWYQTTGDWIVSPERFPDGLQQIRAKLKGYGMRLGLWFGPTSAAVSSRAAREHPEWRASWNEVVAPPSGIWGTEPSYQMCMVSGYSKTFTEKVIAVARATGATYFKWDAVGQHACNDPHHDHGTLRNTPDERDDSYAFQMIGRMTQAAEEISNAVPGAIVDMDVTETGRAFGLGFLAAGKFFLVNNGPYLFDYDLPMDKEKDNWNLFFYPGQARTWIGRAPLGFDKWIPSTLLLTHYFPDDPQNLQELNIASMILGQDGIWGDLTAISPQGIETMSGLIARYKLVRDDMAESDPIVTGTLSGSPEVHEKISSRTGRGAVVMFVTTPGTYEYTTWHGVSSDQWSSGPVQVKHLSGGRVHITATFKEPGARIFYFGASG